jgi:DNA polymerase-3 subunit alpha
MEHTDRVVILVNEAKALGLKLSPPDINRGGLRFEVAERDTIIYGLGAIKGVGEKALEDILSERSSDGPFSDLFSLCRRINSQKVNRKTLEALICAGALDSFGQHRAELLGHLDAAMNAANQHGANLSSGQDDMFGLGAVNAVVESALDVRPWSERKTLEMERLSLGLYLTGHPVDHHRAELAEMTSGPIGKIRAQPERVIILAGLITGLRTFQNRRGETMAFFQLDDPTGRADVSVFGDLYSKVRGTLGSQGVVVVRGICGTDERSGLLAVKADRVLALEDSRATLLRRIAVHLSSSRKGPALLEELQRLLLSHQPGTTEVALHYLNPSGDEVCMTLGSEWHVFPRSDLLDSLRELAGEEGVRLVFDPTASLQDVTDSSPIAA